MAYAGTTSTSPNVPQLISQGISLGSSNVSGSAGVRVGGPRIWHYNSTHLSTDIGSVNFFTDGQKLGFAVGDVVIASEQASTGLVTSHRVLVVGATTTDCSSGVTLGAGI